MKQSSTLSDLFEKLNDLKVVFRYGQKLIPVVQSIIDFMKETVPLLEDINTSIADSTSKIPKVKDQIKNVSCATEMATTEILDIVDSISNDLDVIESNTKSFQEKEEKKKRIWLEIKNMLKDNTNAAKIIDEYEQLDNSSGELDNLHDIISRIKNDVYNITLSLQVQDITSQQLAAVNHLIESVRKRLSSLILNLDENELKELDDDETNASDEKTFNPDAEYVKSDKKQELADVLVNGNLSKASQDEIDKLFS